MSFAKTNIENSSEKQKLIDLFINSVYVYRDKLIVFFNYKNGEKCVDLNSLNLSINKDEHPEN